MIAEGVCGDGRLAAFDSLLGGFKMVFECWPSFVGGVFIVPFADVAGENGGPSDDDDAEVYELRRGFRGMCGVGHVCVFVDGGEDGDDGARMVVRDGFDFGSCGGKGMWRDGAVSVEEGLEDVRDGSFEESSVVVDHVGETVFIKGSVDLLDDGAFDEIARLENGQLAVVKLMGGGDDDCCGRGEVGQDR